MVLYVHDILLVTNDNDLLVETKQLLFSHFDMKDLREASYVLGIQILRDRPSGILRLSQQTYIERIMKGSICNHVLLVRHQLKRVSDFPKVNVLRMILREIR